MTNKTPIFPFHEPQHFSDYGFDSQIDYFQVLEEARKHKRDTTSRSTIENLHFKLQKPISKDETSKKIKKNRKQRWWKNALHFFKRKRTSSSSDKDYDNNIQCMYGGQQHCTVSGPVYLADSRSGSATPYHRTSASRGLLAGRARTEEEAERVRHRNYIYRECLAAEERLTADYFGTILKNKKAWHGKFARGDKKYPTIMFEAVASYDLWIWHAFFGVAGVNNDLTVLKISSLFDDLLDDIAPVAPFKCNGVTFEKEYYLADDIYQQWSSFVKSFTVANSEKNALFKRKQESARKDVE
nr:serine hydroxymethyltransferase [Tanacetum cinerariifolium]